MSPRAAGRTFVAGHRGLVGSAVVRALAAGGHAPPLVRTRDELDLLDGAAVRRFFDSERPERVVLAAAVAGGIHANDTERWRFIYENLAIETNIIGAALEHGVRRLVFLGSSCIYPREAPQPLREDYLLTGPLEPTNEPYAVAKIAGVKLVEAACAQFGVRWTSLMPTNLYGPGDNFDPETSHVLPAMIHKFHRAAQGAGDSVELWGDGSPLRELLHVDDLACAILAALERDDTGLFNVGSGSEVSIRQLAELVAAVAGYRGSIRWDATRPNGTPRKLLDSSRFIRATGWSPRIPLEEGVRSTYAWYLENHAARGDVAASPEVPRAQ